MILTLGAVFFSGFLALIAVILFWNRYRRMDREYGPEGAREVERLTERLEQLKRRIDALETILKRPPNL